MQLVLRPIQLMPPMSRRSRDGSDRRRAILTDRRARGIGGVEPVVAVGAQAAEWAEPERGEIATMRRVVIGNARWRDAPRFQAEPT